MRYAYYYEMQGSEKLAMQKYLTLGQTNASLCEVCEEYCVDACPYGLDIPTHLTIAHSMLTLG